MTTLCAFGYNPKTKKNLILVQFQKKKKKKNADNYYFMYLGKNTEENETFIFNNLILRITVGNKLTLKSQIKILCKKATQKIGALSKLLNHLNQNMINKIHEHVLR